VGVFLVNLLQLAFIAVWLLVLARVLLSWFDPAGRSQAGSIVISMTEPFLGPIRRALPPTGALDLSPRTVAREWEKARMILHDAIAGS
jgi:YggT family protein